MVHDGTRIVRMDGVGPRHEHRALDEHEERQVGPQKSHTRTYDGSGCVTKAALPPILDVALAGFIDSAAAIGGRP